MNIRAIAFTEKGQGWQEKLGFPVTRGVPVMQWAREAFADADALLFIGACGIAVRAIAPLCRDKAADPAVLVMDEMGRHIIPILSGHIGGANDLALLLAERTGRKGVTFASRRGRLLAAGLVSGQRCSGGRALCGAAVAAASSLALLAPTAPWSVGLFYKGGTGALAVAAAYGWPGWRAFVRLLAWFWLLNLMLTGAVLLPGARMEVNNLSVYLPLSPEVLLVSAGCVYGGLTLALHLLGDGKKACFPAELEIAGVVLQVRAFHDTGFGVREPLSGCGVVLVRFAAVEARLPPALRTYLKETFSGSGILPPPELGVRLVPCDTVAGHCLLPAVPAQALRWTARGRQQTRHGLYAAFCDMPPPPPGWTLLVGSDVMEGS